MKDRDEVGMNNNNEQSSSGVGLDKKYVFQFPQFTVVQDICSHKIGTDSMILGSYSARIFSDIDEVRRVLDVGSGSGVLSLMMAQKYTRAQVDAVDVEQDSYLQTKSNFENGPWSDRMHAHHSSIQQFAGNAKGQYNNNVGGYQQRTETPDVGSNILKYDLIISNPPFFNDLPKASTQKRTTARHTECLSFDELLECVTLLLDHCHGTFVLVLPHPQSTVIFEEKAQKYGFVCKEMIEIRNKPNSKVIRHIYQLQISGNSEQPFFCESVKPLFIRTEEGRYAQEFREFVGEYQTHFNI